MKSIKNPIIALSAAAAISLSLPGAALAKTPSARRGKAIAGMCESCHGAHGVAVNGTFPNLAGQNYQYLLHQLEAFKSGDRKSPIMSNFAKMLSRQKMEDVAAYFSDIDPYAKTCKAPKKSSNG